MKIFTFSFRLLAALAAAGCFSAPLTAQVSRYAYATNLNDNNISGYSIDGRTGALQPLATSPYPAGTTPLTLAIDPSNQFLYTTNVFSNNISEYSIDLNTGALVSLGAVPAGTNPNAIAIHPKGKYVYVANYGSNDMSVFAIQASGQLTSLGPPVSTGLNPHGVAIDSAGHFVYVGNHVSNNVSGYVVSKTGALVEIAGSPFAAGGNPHTVVVTAPSKGKQYVLVANVGSSNISVYSVDSTTGALTQVSGSPFPTGFAPEAISLDPLNQFVYVGNYFSGDVYGYAINFTTGALSPVSGSPFPVGNALRGVSVDSSGQFAFVTNSAGNSSGLGQVSSFTITRTGMLVPTCCTPVGAGNDPGWVATTH
jgi:6-phosphogluconolactonase